jgi:hypothetical protein
MKKSDMPKLTLTQVIAQRTFQLVTTEGRKRHVHLRFGKPRQSNGGSSYLCVYQIEGLEEDAAKDTRLTRQGGGADGVQALYLTMCQASTELAHSKPYKEGRLTWNGLPDLGLPDIENVLHSTAKNSEAQRRLEEALDMLDPGGEYHVRGKSASRSRGRRRPSPRRR